MGEDIVQLAVYSISICISLVELISIMYFQWEQYLQCLQLTTSEVLKLLVNHTTNY